MLPKNVYNSRLEICKMCEFWNRSRCRKGHLISSTTGCPIQKFPPINGADYDTNTSPAPVETPVQGCPGCPQSVQNLSWEQVADHFARSMATWAKSRLAVVSPAIHSQRQAKCAVCPHRSGYWCTPCKCLIYLKTKLATEQCPDNPPRWTKV